MVFNVCVTVSLSDSTFTVISHPSHFTLKLLIILTMLDGLVKVLSMDWCIHEQQGQVKKEEVARDRAQLQQYKDLQGRISTGV